MEKHMNAAEQAQRSLALTKLTEILLDKLQHRKCLMFEKISVCLAMQS